MANAVARIPFIGRAQVACSVGPGAFFGVAAALLQRAFVADEKGVVVFGGNAVKQASAVGVYTKIFDGNR